eukprot:m.434288 g.434288  ORF g.434288 m.434288 type:complete len:239 (+) comp17687_c0_seq1:388-1104(+)
MIRVPQSIAYHVSLDLHRQRVKFLARPMPNNRLLDRPIFAHISPTGTRAQLDLNRPRTQPPLLHGTPPHLHNNTMIATRTLALLVTAVALPVWVTAAPVPLDHDIQLNDCAEGDPNCEIVFRFNLEDIRLLNNRFSSSGSGSGSGSGISADQFGPAKGKKDKKGKKKGKSDKKGKKGVFGSLFESASNNQAAGSAVAVVGVAAVVGMVAAVAIRRRSANSATSGEKQYLMADVDPVAE